MNRAKQSQIFRENQWIARSYGNPTMERASRSNPVLDDPEARPRLTPMVEIRELDVKWGESWSRPAAIFYFISGLRRPNLLLDMKLQVERKGIEPSTSALRTLR